MVSPLAFSPLSNPSYTPRLILLLKYCFPRTQKPLESPSVPQQDKIQTSDSQVFLQPSSIPSGPLPVIPSSTGHLPRSPVCSPLYLCLFCLFLQWPLSHLNPTHPAFKFQSSCESLSLYIIFYYACLFIRPVYHPPPLFVISGKT